MPATFNDMVTDVLALLHGYVRTQEQSTYLTATVNSSVTTLSVGDPSRVSRGIAEIEDELVYVDSVDRNAATGQVTLAPYGRGYFDSLASSHNANTQVVFSPLFPRVRVKRAINDTILSVGNELFAIGTTTFTYTPSIVTYGLPADTIDVLSVSFDTVGPSLMWAPVNRFRFDANANLTDFPTGKTIDIYGAVTPGRTVQVKTSKYPSEMSANADVFATVTGLLESSRDCIVYGAAARLTAGVDSALMNVQAIEPNALDDTVQPGAGANLSRTLYQLHRQRLMEERMRYLQKYPTPVYYAR